MEYQPLKYIYKASGNPEAYTLLLLHGTGGDENDLLGLGESFGADLNLLSVRGNVSEHGMPRYFKRLGMGIFDEQDVNFRAEELLSFVENLAVQEGFDIKKVVALGYSNGANIAGAILVKSPEAFAGAILFRPMPPFKTIPVFSSTRKAPVFFSSGAVDPTVDPGSTKAYIETLESGGFHVTSYSLPASHNLTQEDVELAREWFNKSFR
ncbi:MAG: alpha/beta hydrolase [Pedobacter sp.]